VNADELPAAPAWPTSAGLIRGAVEKDGLESPLDVQPQRANKKSETDIPIRRMNLTAYVISFSRSVPRSRKITTDNHFFFWVRPVDSTTKLRFLSLIYENLS
jgi:hypothetical protein